MKFYMLAFVLFLTSCVNLSATKPNANSSDSIIKLVKKYWKSSEGGLISIASLKSPSEEHNGIQSFRLWWCLDNGSSTNELKQLVARHCSNKNGLYFDSWCYEKDTEQPIYFAHIGKASSIEIDTSPVVPYCSSGPNDIGVYIVENRNKSKEDWCLYARNELGFLTTNEKNRIKKEKELKMARELFMSHMKKIEQANYMLNNRGTKVCKSGYFGFVEDSNKGKIKVNIVGVYTFAVAIIDHPYTIWDDPMNWHICE